MTDIELDFENAVQWQSNDYYQRGDIVYLGNQPDGVFYVLNNAQEYQSDVPPDESAVDATSAWTCVHMSPDQNTDATIHYPGSTIVYDGTTFVAQTTIIGRGPNEDPVNWLAQSTFSDWDATVSYDIGTAVRVETGTDTYSYFVSKITDNLGNDPLTSSNAWYSLDNATAYLGEWVSSQIYYKGEIVRYQNKYYVCIDDNGGVGIINVAPTDTTHWSETQYQEPSITPWTAGETYATGDKVTYNGWIYESQTNNNTSTPSESSTSWIRYNTVVKGWNSNTSYVKDDQVLRNNVVYVAVKPSTNVDPATETGNDTYWKKVEAITGTYVSRFFENSQYNVSTGIMTLNGDTLQSGTITTTKLSDLRYYEDWDSSTQYTKGERVYYNDVIYVANYTNTGNNPSESPYYWTESPETTDSAVYFGSAIKLDPSGLKTYSLNATTGQQDLQCYVGSDLDGSIIAGGGAVKLNSSGLTTYNPLGSNPNQPQVVIGTDGSIKSGDQTSANAVTIDRDGLKISGAIPLTISEWDSSVTYKAGDIVSVTSGNVVTLFMSLKSGNINNDPTTSPDWWLNFSDISLEDAGITEWEPNIAYVVDDFVIYKPNGTDGVIYRCNTAHTSGSTFDNTKWTTITTYTTGLSGNIYASQNAIYSGNASNFGSVRITSTGLDTYDSSNNLQCSVGTNGAITAGGGQVVINSSGLTTYASTDTSHTTPICYVGTDGTIYGTRAVYATSAGSAATATSASSAGYATSAGSATTANSATTATSATTAGTATDSDNTKTIGKISNGYVEIDANGLRTYNSNNHSTGHTSANLQCEVGTDGAITAGAGGIKLSKSGIDIYEGSGRSGSISFHNSSNVINAIMYDISGQLSIDSKGMYLSADWGESSSEYKMQMNNSSGYMVPLFRRKPTTSSSTDIPATRQDGDIPMIQVTTKHNSSGTAGTWSTYVYFNPNIAYGTYGYRMLIMGGYNTASTATITQVTFPKSFDHQCVYAGCTTIRNSSSGDGNDYVSNSSSSNTVVGKTGMYCKHDSGAGFYWIAIGF